MHIAARFGRADVVMYLLSLDDINDTIPNFSGKQPVEVARTPELAEAMQVVRAQFVESVALKMKRYFSESNIPALEDLLSIPRAATLLDINGQDPDTGSTVLHDFVKSRNIPMIEFVLSHGGDPLRRNFKGVLPIDTTKDEQIRSLLKQATKSQTVIIQTPNSQALASSAGSSSGDAIGEEDTYTNAPAPSMKGFLKKWTNFTGGYKLRWFVLENGVLSYYKKQDDTESSCRGSINLKNAKLHLNSSEKLEFRIVTKDSTFHLKANHPVETNRWVWALTNAIQYAKDQEKRKINVGKKRLSANAQLASPTVSSFDQHSSLMNRNFTPRSISSHEEEAHNQDVARLVSLSNNEASKDDENYQSDYDDDEDDQEPPHSEDILSSLDSVRIGLSSVATTIKSLKHNSETNTLAKTDLEKGLSALDQAMGMINTLIQQYTLQIYERENFFKRKIERDEELQELWASTIRELELEQDKIEGRLHKAKKANKVLREVVTRSPSQQAAIPTVEKQPENTEVGVEAVTQNLAPTAEIEDDDSSDDEMFYDAADEFEDAASSVTYVDNTDSKAQSIKSKTVNEGEDALKNEDVENLTPAQKEVYDKMIKNNSFAGYEDGIRKKLTMDDDNRPKISLWGVLRSLVGKDMTKMTLPVSFNECTNLLQRSAEDMEYTDLLDKAASAVDDPGLRMVYVAAYAASSYSSTIDRIAKPFNPLLGETFEYCRPDRGYRLFSEQVSHHPPIGALIAESPRWEFYGDSNVKSQFYGRSFDINPTGLWYLKLRPNKGSDIEEEIYTFRKITSSVVGIITGSPTVDNYGNMEIVNHTLNYRCTVCFKPRGWRGSGAFELKGTVVSDIGIPLWMVRGKWNDKIFARRLDHLSPIPIVNGKPEMGDGSKDESFSNYTQIWKVHYRPKAPFNLTPFAITLNALPERLKEWIAPTDTRFRPDQRAMEEGRYNDASDDKHRVEEKQRSARRERENKGIEYKAQYFEKKIHPVTKQEYWSYKGNYWEWRQRKELKDKGDIF